MAAAPSGRPSTKASKKGSDRARAAAVPRRVVSVSPSRTNGASGTSNVANGANGAPAAPPGVERKACDEMAGTLRALLDEAGRAVDRLNLRIGDSRDADGAWARASEQLQERLRLGARMLKAFEAQIERVETLLDEIDERGARADAAGGALAQHLVTYESGVESALERGRAWENEAATRLESAAEAAVERVETRAAAQQKDLDAGEARLAELERRAAGLAEQMESIEVTAAMLSHRVGADAKRLAAALHALAGKADELVVSDPPKP